MIPMRWLAYAGIALVAAIALATAKSCADRHDTAPKITPAHQRDLDSLGVTRPMFDSIMTARQARITKDSLARVRAQALANAAEQRARMAQHRADSLAVIADSTDDWRQAYEQRTVEARDWEVTAAQRDTALQKEKAAHDTTRMALRDSEKRRQHLELVTIPGLQRDIARLEQPCRLGFIPCPSRTVTGVLAMAGGVALGYMAPHP